MEDKRYFLRILQASGDIITHEILDDEFDQDQKAYIERARILLKLKKNHAVWVRYGNPRHDAVLSEIQAKLTKLHSGKIVELLIP